jgi:hypothetical protein
MWQEQGKRFGDLLVERGIGKTNFAAEHGLAYYHVHRWTLGYAFGPENQAIAARGLNLPDNAFETPDEARTRELETRAVLKRFEREAPVAAALTEADWGVLRSIRFHDAALRPSIAFFTAVAFALKGAIRLDEVASVTAENAALDDALAHKPPLRRR